MGIGACVVVTDEFPHARVAQRQEQRDRRPGQVPPSANDTIPSPVPPTAIATTSASAPTVATPVSTAACALITPSEAATALGTGSTLPESRAIAGQVPTCNFEVAGKVRFKLFLHKYVSVKEAIQAVQTAVDRVKKDPAFQQITGLGDEAFAKGTVLAVRKQAVVLTVSVIASKDSASDISIAKSLAQTGIAHLP